MSDTTYSIGAVPMETDRSRYPGDGETMSKLLADATASLDTDRDAAKACIQCAADLLRSYLTGNKKHARIAAPIGGGLAPWQKQRVAAYVAAHLGSSIRAASLANVVGLSKGHFFRAFRASFGEAPLAYVTKERMRRCQELMLSSDAPLSEIALDCGMCDQAHLTRVFRRFVGVNPGRWRRQVERPAAIGDVATRTDLMEIT